MSMSKKDFIALADYVKQWNNFEQPKFSDEQINQLARFCQSQNPRFMRDRWLAYIAGECGPNGGTIKGR